MGTVTLLIVVVSHSKLKQHRSSVLRSAAAIMGGTLYMTVNCSMGVALQLVAHSLLKEEVSVIFHHFVAMRLTQILVVPEGVFATGPAVTDKKQSSSIMRSIASQVQSSQSVHSQLQVAASSVLNQMKSSLAADTAAMTHKTELDPFTFVSGKVSTRSLSPASKRAVAPIPTPPGTPVTSLPPSIRPSEVPAGVPDYNFRMCQVDLIRMGQAKQSLVFDVPKGSPQSKLLPKSY